nr:hypothetical protein K-LCC10_0501 [Kaumoebavirus]
MESFWQFTPLDVVAVIMSQTPETYWKGMMMSKAVQARIKVCLPKFRAVREFTREGVVVVRGEPVKCMVLPNGNVSGMEYYKGENIRMDTFKVNDELIFSNIYYTYPNQAIVHKWKTGKTIVIWETGMLPYREIHDIVEDFGVCINDGRIGLTDFITGTDFFETQRQGYYHLLYRNMTGTIEIEYPASRIWELMKRGEFYKELLANLEFFAPENEIALGDYQRNCPGVE